MYTSKYRATPRGANKRLTHTARKGMGNGKVITRSRRLLAGKGDVELVSDVQPKHEGPLWKKKQTKENRGIQWSYHRRQYLRKHVVGDPYPHWACAKCGKWLDASSVTVDHIIKRSVRPDLIFDKSNFQILCWPCHWAKDSGMRFK